MVRYRDFSYLTGSLLCRDDREANGETNAVLSIETDQIELKFWIFDLPCWSAKTTLFGI